MKELNNNADPGQDPGVDEAGELVAALSLSEQAALTAGSDMWHTVGLPAAGIPVLRCSDGPNGVRGLHAGRGPTSAAFPVATALAATWNVDLVAAVGSALAQEAGDKGVQVLLAPTLNLQRHPLGGRNFECFSEDPYLSARLAVAFIGGVQGGGVAATAKHFVANDSEHDRHRVSVEISMRALRELYLVPFEAAVAEAGVWAVMTAYNRLNGTHCAANHWLLSEVLKGEWGFDGVVMSDWFGTYSTLAPALAGLDLEMPGPACFQGEQLAELVVRGDIPASILVDKGRRLVRLARRVGAVGPGAAGREPTGLELTAGVAGSERSVERPEIWALARRAAGQAMVVLRNDGLLPLQTLEIGQVAIIGPNASPGQIMGGGSSQVRPYRTSSPLEALGDRFGPEVVVRYEPGCRTHRLCPRLDPTAFELYAYDSLEPQGDPVWIDHTDEVGGSLGGAERSAVDPQAFAVSYRGTFVAAHRGEHLFGVTAIGRSRVLVEGVLIVDNWSNPQPGHTFYANGTAEVQGSVFLAAGQAVAIQVDYQRRGGLFPAVRLGVELPEPDDLFDRAVGAARGADLVIVVVGSNEEWEGEGADRVDFCLPGAQNQLIDAVLAANRNTVVVLNTGSPVAMHWADKAAALVQAWYPGMAFGEALVDVLFGDVNPSGRLPSTFPKRLEDHPAYLNYPPEGGRLLYGEGVFVGYRGFDARDTDPLFPFGFGLSYTTFAYGALHAQLDLAGRRVRVELDITNIGDRAGAEVVQLYVGDDESAVARPPKELKGFRRVELTPGQCQRVGFDLDERAFSFWDPDRQEWRLEPGRFALLAGASSRDIRASTAIIW